MGEAAVTAALGTIGKISGRLHFSAPLRAEPFPYFIADDVLPRATVRSMLEHWPEPARFAPEIPHNYTFSLLSGCPPFWREFGETTGKDLARSALARFLPWISERYPADTELILRAQVLMQADPTYEHHDTHTHHYHDPGWVMTLLLYLDHSPGFPGTTIRQYRAKDIDDDARMAARTHQWQLPEIAEVETAAFIPNRMIAFLDNPIAYHSVGAAAPGAQGHRRVFRMHITVPEEAAMQPYGISLTEYRQRRLAGEASPQMLGWLRRDIAQMRAVSARWREPSKLTRWLNWCR